jgi:hypothetical protein
MTQATHTEPIDLPSKGWFYEEGHPLAAGKLDLYPLTAKHEDILTSKNLIVKGVVIDKLLEALIATPGVKIGDLLIGDKNAVMIAARILGYGRMYPVKVDCPACGASNELDVDLQALDDKVVEFSPSQKGSMEFNYQLPVSQRTITFRLLTHNDDVAIRRELEAMRKALKTDVTAEVTTRMRYSIVAVEGDRDRETLRKAVDNMLAADARAFRKHAAEVNPNIDLTFDFDCSNCGESDRLGVPIDHTFFWPNG